GAAGDDDLHAGPVAPETADRLPRLAHGFAGHGAGVDDHRLGHAGGLGLAPHRFGFDDVEPAAEGDDVEGHSQVLVPGAAQHEVMRCRTGTVSLFGGPGSAVHRCALRACAAPRPGHE